MTALSSSGGEETHAAVHAWFETLERCVRSVDYETARGIFAPDVVSFGTRAEIVSGLDALQAEQWSGVWPNISDFTFDLASLHVAGNGESIWAAVVWTSTGYHEDGTPFARPGRATVTFTRRGGRWVATHTHFSLKPGTPPQSYGRRAGA